jgi:ZIP family zinc transporter
VADTTVLFLIAAAGMSTALGGIPLVAIRRLTHKTHDTILGLGAGIMLGVSIFDLLLQLGEHPNEGWLLIVAGILAGAAVITILVGVFRKIPLPMPFIKNPAPVTTGAAFLIFIALLIHNLPEGLATGIGYGHGPTGFGNAIALSIAFQNVPEGLLVAVAVLAETGSKRAGFGYAALSGVVEPVAGYVAYFTLSLSPQAVGVVSGFAAGAMLAVVFFQMIPESHSHGYRVPATAALAAGILMVLAVNLMLGQISF